MARRNMNLYGSTLGLTEDMEQRQNIEDNFGDLYGEDRNFADELSAAKGGVSQGQLYHTNGTVKTRYSLIPIPPVGQLRLVGAPPLVLHTMMRTPTVGALTLSGVAPVVTQQLTIIPGSASLTISGKVPVLT